MKYYLLAIISFMMFSLNYIVCDDQMIGLGLSVIVMIYILVKFKLFIEKRDFLWAFMFFMIYIVLFNFMGGLYEVSSLSVFALVLALITMVVYKIFTKSELSQYRHIINGCFGVWMFMMMLTLIMPQVIIDNIEFTWQNTTNIKLILSILFSTMLMPYVIIYKYVEVCNRYRIFLKCDKII